MDRPDKRLFDADISSAEFRNGVVRRRWGLREEAGAATKTAWPTRILWIGAAQRDGAPDRFYVALDLADYRTVSPTGTFWDSVADSKLKNTKRPRGREGSRVAKVFRIDWHNGDAFYHPYDRVATAGHRGWRSDHPNLVWTVNHTIVDYLWEFHLLLNSADYLGVRGPRLECP